MKNKPWYKDDQVIIFSLAIFALSFAFGLVFYMEVIVCPK